MEIKEISPIPAIYVSTETTMKDIWSFVQVTPEKLYQKAEKLGLLIQGPQHWVYLNADGNPDTRFTLEIALPVDKKMDESEFKDYQPFKCATVIHKGPWNNFDETYKKLVSEIYQAGYNITNECREIYHVVDMEDPNRNITEIQMGIN